jgi:hypothetical protein
MFTLKNALLKAISLTNCKQPTAVEWFLHYWCGKGEEKTFTSKQIEKINIDLLPKVLAAHKKGQLGVGYKSWARPSGQDLYLTVGGFDFEVTQIDGDEVTLSCSDYYDWNKTSDQAEGFWFWTIDAKHLMWARMASRLAPFKITLLQEGQKIPAKGESASYVLQTGEIAFGFHESQLNEIGNHFWTRWESKISIAEVVDDGDYDDYE